MSQVAPHPFPEHTYRHFLENLLSGNRHPCGKTVTDLLDAGTGIREIYLDLLQRAMYEVGELWESNRISVAKEHLATSITEEVMSLVYPRMFSGFRIGRKAVISCIANEYHQIGGKMAADIFELNGWDGWFLGANTPESELLSFLQEKKPDVLGLSLAVYFNIPSLTAALDAVRNAFPHLDIFVGGQAFRWGGQETVERYPRVLHIQSIHRLEELIKEGWQ